MHLLFLLSFYCTCKNCSNQWYIKMYSRGEAYLKKAILVLNIRRVCDPSPAQGDNEKNTELKINVTETL